ncbi:SGNH hydrolase-type esterase domain-containing protein [Trametes gibbosa]|nr:SGNH hydrolase-type esterase domain-containing protein [Trametes gibbosa]
MTANVQDAIVLLGDSLTEFAFAPEGLGTKLADAYVRKLDVVNRGLSGYNTDWIIPVFEQIWPKQHEQQHHPTARVLVVWFGANDAALPQSKQHVPLARYETNLAWFAHALRSPESAYYSPQTRLVYMTPPPVQAVRWAAALGERVGTLEAPDRDLEQSRVYAEAVKKVGGSENVPVADVWGNIWEAAGREEGGLAPFLVDGLHLTGKGYKVVYDALIATIAESFPELHYDRLQPTFPIWSDIVVGIDQQRDYRELTKKKVQV